MMLYMQEPYDTWVCYVRSTITDGTVLGWTPTAWVKDQFVSYAVTASRHGVLIGEIYLHQIPDNILSSAREASTLLAQERIEEARAFATHERIRIGNSWHIVTIKETSSL